MKSKEKHFINRLTAAVIINLLLLPQLAFAGNNTSTLAPEITIATDKFQFGIATLAKTKILQGIDSSSFSKNSNNDLLQGVSLIVSKKGNNILARHLASGNGISQEEVIITKHKDGESKPVVINPQNIEGQTCLIVHTLRSKTEEIDEDSEFVELLFLIGGLRDFKAKNINCLLPQSLFERSPALLEILGTITNKIYITEDNNFNLTGTHLKTSVVSLPKLEPIISDPQTLDSDIEAALFTRARAELHLKVAKSAQTHVLTGRLDLRTLKWGRTTRVEFPKRGIKGKRALLFHTTKTDRGLVQLLLALYELSKAEAEEIITFLGYMGYARGHENYPALDYGPQAQIVNCAKIILDIISYFSGKLAIVNAHFLKNPADNKFTYLKNPLNFTRRPKQEELAYLKNLKIDNLNGIDLLARHCIRHFDAKNPILIAPDEGIYPFIKEAALKLGLDSGYIKKRREFGEVVREKEEVIDGQDNEINIQGRNVIILDDIIAGGTTTISAANICNKLKARRIFAGAVHGIFAKGKKGFDQDIKGLIEGVIATDSIITDYSIVSLAKLIVSYLGYEQFSDEVEDIVRRRDPGIKSPYDVINDLDASANYWWHILREDENTRREMEDRLHQLIDRNQFTEKIIRWVANEGFEAEKIIVMGDYLVRRKTGVASDLDILAVVKGDEIIKEEFVLDFDPLPKVAIAIRSEGFLNNNEETKKRVDTWINTGGIEIYNKKQSVAIQPEFEAIIERAEELISAGNRELGLAMSDLSTPANTWWRFFEASLALNYLLDKLLSSNDAVAIQFKQFYQESIEEFYVAHFLAKKIFPFEGSTSEMLEWLEDFDFLLRTTKDYLLNKLKIRELEKSTRIEQREDSLYLQEKLEIMIYQSI